MTQASLGLIETIGLTAAVTAADAAVKSANVELVGYELAKGGGMTMVKVRGNVGAVKAAVAAASVAASAINSVVSVTVIARPAQGIGGMIASPETIGAVGAVAAACPDPAAEETAVDPMVSTDSTDSTGETPTAGTEISATEAAGVPAPMEEQAGPAADDAPEAVPAPKAAPAKPGGKPGKKPKR